MFGRFPAPIPWVLIVVLTSLVHADTPAKSEKVLDVTVEWRGEDIQVTKVETKDGELPHQNGFPQLWARYFELRNKAGDEGDVHYAGPLVDQSAFQKGENGAPGGYVYRVILPDLPEARHLVIISRDEEKGRKIVLEKDL